MSAVDEVADLVEQRESLLVEGFHLVMTLKRGRGGSEKDKLAPHIYKSGIP